MKKIILLIAALLIVNISYAQQAPKIDKQTFLYSEKGDQKLLLDRYVMEGNNDVKPCIIFMFGGGFMFGSRDMGGYIDYFEFLAEQGYCVVSIDYRLGFKGYTPNPDEGPVGALTKFVNTIDIAVEDLFDATSFVVRNAQEWKVDTTMIIANGSSAGAISVLQGEYYISNGHQLAKKLPQNFNYAGVIGFAGAVFTIGGFKWNAEPCPIQMFHGDADNRVPYDNVVMAGVGFYGSKYIAGTLDTAGYPYYFYSATDSGHEIAGDPMSRCRGEIMTFLDNEVKGKLKEQINTTVKVIGRPEREKNFQLGDYLKSNFGG